MGRQAQSSKIPAKSAQGNLKKGDDRSLHTILARKLISLHGEEKELKRCGPKVDEFVILQGERLDTVELLAFEMDNREEVRRSIRQENIEGREDLMVLHLRYLVAKSKAGIQRDPYKGKGVIDRGDWDTSASDSTRNGGGDTSSNGTGWESTHSKRQRRD